MHVYIKKFAFANLHQINKTSVQQLFFDNSVQTDFNFRNQHEPESIFGSYHFHGREQSKRASRNRPWLTKHLY